MKLTPRSCFKGSISIPNVTNPNPNSNNSGNGQKLDIYVEEYERDVLTKCLGYSLYAEFLRQFDEDGKLKDGVNSKWKDLLEGKEYEVHGLTVKWDGLFYKLGNTDYGLTAYYIYYYFMLDDVAKYTTTGIQVEKTKNAVKVSPTPKAVNAWRKFYELTVGSHNQPRVIYNGSTYGIDYFGIQNSKRSLYQFIQDSNNLAPETYPNWQPYHFENKNSFGI